MSFEQQLISWRRELHQYPELSLQEVATTARIRDWLESGGLRVLPYALKNRPGRRSGQRREDYRPACRYRCAADR
ncbi:Uncharacterized hydrolase YxeP [Raoultella ornithinolytica]|nr:Uncharacterized hydrolase YxeP [Raoultella ornithinolytica]